MVEAESALITSREDGNFLQFLQRRFSLDGGDWYLARRSLRVALDRFARWNVFFSGCDTHCSHGDASLFLARRFPRTLFLASLGIPEALCEGERHHGVLGECPRRKNVRILWALSLIHI